jgi:cold shock CspA family protein
MAEQGKVKFFDAGRGFGFIAPDSDKIEDLFVHINDCKGQPPKDDDVRGTFNDPWY